MQDGMTYAIVAPLNQDQNYKACNVFFIPFSLIHALLFSCVQKGKHNLLHCMLHTAVYILQFSGTT